MNSKCNSNIITLKTPKISLAEWMAYYFMNKCTIIQAQKISPVPYFITIVLNYNILIHKYY